MMGRACPPLLKGLLWTARTRGIRLTRHLLQVAVDVQTLWWLERQDAGPENPPLPAYELRRTCCCSTSRFGIGQVIDSNCTPLGLHRVATKCGGGQPVGTVLRNREPVGLTWNGLPDAPIAHRVLWLEGLEPGYNRGGDVDSYRRYIYIHGVGNELTLGRPASHGCIHLASSDLIPLYDRLPEGTLVWIAATWLG